MLKKRQKEILSKLKEKTEVTVNELSSFFNVSLVTIRRDLESMEKEGYLKRFHGGAILLEEKTLNSELPYAIRLTQNFYEKELIAQEAVKYIDDNEVILIDSGTTTVQIAKLINEKTNLVLITNSLNTAVELSTRKGISIYFLGGIIDSNTMSTTGNLAIEFLQKFHAKKLFLGVGGISIEHGITYFDLIENDLRKLMIEKSEIRIILADHSKFDRIATATACPISSIDYLITDNKAPKNVLSEIRKLGVKVIIVGGEENTDKII